MSVSSAKALTRQFYEWERCGRGWHKAEFSCDLEPPFVPFFGHVIEGGEIIDDGIRPRWWSQLFSSPEPPQAAEQEEPIRAFPHDDDTPLRVYGIALPKNFGPGADRMEQLLVMLSYLRSPVSIEVVGRADTIALQCTCREADALFLQAQVRAFFPDCNVIDNGSDALFEALATELPLYTVDFGLQDEFMRPIAMHSGSDTDPYTAFFGSLSGLGPSEYVILQTLFSGTHNAWAESVTRSVCDESGRQSFFTDAPDMPQLAREKVSRPLYGVSIRTVAIASTLQQAGVLLRDVATALVHASRGSNALIPLSDGRYGVHERLADIALRQSHRVGMLLNSRELATLAHFPPARLSRKLLSSQGVTKRAPAHLVDERYCLGVNRHHGTEQSVGIDVAQRMRHVHIIGATGTGKSTLMRSLIMQDVEQDNGVCVIDPHGDLIDAILGDIPERRVRDVVLFDPADSQYPIGLNMLLAHSDQERELLASDLVALFRRFSTSWGDQMNSVFANAISAFVYNAKPGHLGDLRKFLIDQPFRNAVLATCTDPDIAYYWQKEYPILKSSSIGSILTRLDAFLRPKIIRNMVCQRQSLDFQKLMDGKKIILVKLSQGVLGEENSYLLGAFIVSKLQQTAMARQAQRAENRVPFYCYVDEFQNFVTPSMNAILSGARKYSLGLVLAHQDMQQVARADADIANSVIANAGTRICFRLGDTDAKRMQEGFSGFTHEDLQNLSTGEAIVRVNTREQDFNLTVSPYEERGNESAEAIVSYSRAKYGAPMETPSAESAPVEERATHSEAPPVPKAEPITGSRQNEITEHRYMQTFIKKLGEECGYRASIEVRTPDGRGMVDVLLEKGDQQIALEISVTTTAAWELHNIRKCLSAGYATVAVCTTSRSKMEQIQALVQSELSRQEQEKVRVIPPDLVHALFEKDEMKKEATTVLKGYRVKVQYEPSAGGSKNEIIQRIVNAKKR